jgi:hypothetical protein
MLVILGQLQAEVDEKTMAVKVARERVSELLNTISFRYSVLCIDCLFMMQCGVL